MIIVMKPYSKKEEVNRVLKIIEKNDLHAHISQGEQVTIIGVIGDKTRLRDVPLNLLPGVDKVVHIVEPYKLVNKNFHPEKTVIDVEGSKIGGKELAIMGGPCAVESLDQILKIARYVKSKGAQFLRGGAYKPRTNPYSFQGLKEEGLKYLFEAKKETGLKIVTEVVNEESVNKAYQYVDIFQIGARNMQNFHLLSEVGKTDKPVILKRGFSSTIDEWLNAAEYIMSEGNYNVILCERGIRTFETATRNTLDLSAVPVLKSKTHLPIIVDPSHAAGLNRYVIPLSQAAIAAGADGLIVETHHDPENALSDGQQSLDTDEFTELMDKLKKLAPLFDRSL